MMSGCAIPRSQSHILDNTDFKTIMDLVLYREYNLAENTQHWKDFMSGDWAWEEAVCYCLCCVLPAYHSIGYHCS